MSTTTSPSPSARAPVHGWIGVDLDGTLAHYDGWRGGQHIGEPIPAMLARVRRWLDEGREVRVFTARASQSDQVGPVRAWLDALGLQAVAVTNVKDFSMVELWDDRCVQVEPNTGAAYGPSRVDGDAADPIPVKLEGLVSGACSAVLATFLECIERRFDELSPMSKLIAGRAVAAAAEDLAKRAGA